ncbi:hypothetical protein EV363DRAFT_1180785 [Boletus edulis]|nr:hypothetical protein EV363DRAFT_1180785 [Boletus edulis]
MFQGPANTFGTCTWFSTEGPSHTVGPPTSPGLFRGLYTTDPCRGHPSLVMLRAWLGLKALAWAWLDRAWA